MKGHKLRMVVMETFGGLSPGAVEVLEELARAHGAKMGADEESSLRRGRSFKRAHAMRITIALHTATADEILRTVQMDCGAMDWGPGEC